MSVLSTFDSKCDSLLLWMQLLRLSYYRVQNSLSCTGIRVALRIPKHPASSPVQHIAAGPRQHSRSWYRAPLGSWPYFCSFQTCTCFEMGPPPRRKVRIWLLLVTPPLFREWLVAVTLTQPSLATETVIPASRSSFRLAVGIEIVTSLSSFAFSTGTESLVQSCCYGNRNSPIME
jgi:hypothetical protein